MKPCLTLCDPVACSRQSCPVLHYCPEFAQILIHRGAPLAQTVKNLPVMQQTWVLSLGEEDPLEKDMAISSSILVWKIPWREEPSRLSSMGSQSRTWLKRLSTHTTTCPLSQWCHPAIYSSVGLFSFCMESFPASGSFPMSRNFASGGQSIGALVSASVLHMNTQGLFLLGLIFLISYLSKGLSPAP